MPTKNIAEKAVSNENVRMFYVETNRNDSE